MVQIYFVKTLSELLLPITPEAHKYMQALKNGIQLNCNVRQAHNYLFHKNDFCLLKYGYEYWKQSGGLERRRTAAGVCGMSRKIINAALGRGFQICISDVCNFISETVLAHYRLTDTCGTGMKPSDEQGSHVCSACHKAVDRHICDNFTREELRLFRDESALCKQAWVRKEAK